MNRCANCESEQSDKPYPSVDTDKIIDTLRIYWLLVVVHALLPVIPLIAGHKAHLHMAIDHNQALCIYSHIGRTAEVGHVYHGLSGEMWK